MSARSAMSASCLALCMCVRAHACVCYVQSHMLRTRAQMKTMSCLYIKMKMFTIIIKDTRS